MYPNRMRCQLIIDNECRAVHTVGMADETIQVAVRVPKELLGRVDAYAAKVATDRPGARSTRADALRVLVEMGLAEAGFPSPGTSTKARRRR